MHSDLLPVPGPLSPVPRSPLGDKSLLSESTARRKKERGPQLPVSTHESGVLLMFPFCPPASQAQEQFPLQTWQNWSLWST